MADALAAQQISDGASHQYRLDETSGTTATDRGSVPINGTYANCTLNQTPIVSGSTGCVLLNGSTSYADFNWDVTAILSQAWSVEAVFSPVVTSTAGNRLLANDSPSADSKGMAIVGDNYTGSYGGISAAFSGGNADSTPGSLLFAAGMKYLVQGVWRGSTTSVLELWINGVKVQSLTTSGNYVAAGYHMRLGMNPQGSNLYLNAYVSDLALYNFALTTTQIANHLTKLAFPLGKPGSSPFASIVEANKAPHVALVSRPQLPNTGALGQNAKVGASNYGFVS